MKGFHERFVEALRRRLYPNSTLRLKQVAAAIGRNESSVARWWRGDTHVLADDPDRMARYFADLGDYAFLGEIFSEPLATKADADRGELVHLLRAVLSAMPASDRSMAQDVCLWVTDRGDIESAPFGHTEYLARTLHLPASVGDLVRYGTDILGWIAITVGAGGHLTVRHDGRKVTPLAAERLSEWIVRRRGEIASVLRSVHVGSEIVEARHDSVTLAIEALQSVAFITRQSRRPWTVKRLSLDLIANDRLRRLLQAHQEAPDQVIDVAAKIGAFTDTNIFSVDGDNVRSLFVPSRYLISRQAIQGQNLMSLPDTDYAMMVRARILTTMQEGPFYCELSGTLNNEYLHYLNLAIPVRGTHDEVLTSTVVIRQEIMG